MNDESLIPVHGGYRKLKSFQVAQLVYDVTVRFCDLYVDRHSRTRDQMIQAARSGVQNIAEGSRVAGTSRKTELKLTNVARASLEELRLDYEDFLRQRGLTLFSADHPALIRLKAKRCASLQDVQAWVASEYGQARTDTDTHGQGIANNAAPMPEELAANAALSLLNLACYLLDRQLAAQATTFEKEGGFTERLYRVRTEARGRKKTRNS